MTVKSLLTILLGGVLVNNYVFQKFLGVTPFFGNSKKECRAFGVKAECYAADVSKFENAIAKYAAHRSYRLACPDLHS